MWTARNSSVRSVMANTFHFETRPSTSLLQPEFLNICPCAIEMYGPMARLLEHGFCFRVERHRSVWDHVGRLKCTSTGQLFRIVIILAARSYSSAREHHA